MDIIYNFISEELIYALGWTVVHSLWQGCIIAILMAFAMHTLKDKTAKVRYELATFSLFLVFAFSLCTFIWYYIEAGQMVAYESFISNQVIIGDDAGGVSTLHGITQVCMDYFNTHLPTIVLIWLLGVVFFVLRLFGGLAYVQRLKYQESTLLPAKWQLKVQAISKRIPTKKTVQIFESAKAKVPMVIGYFKPFILLPIGTINQLEEKEIEAIIAHELAHVFRNDFLMNIILSFIEVLFYYHPAVWWISGNIRLERENCCDDIAIKVCGNSLTYAKALVRLQELNVSTPRLAMPFSGRKNQLLNRIKRILNQPQNRSNILERLAATGFLLLAIVFMSASPNLIEKEEAKTVTQEEFIEKEVFIPESSKDVFIEEPKKIIVEKEVADTTPEQKKILHAETLKIIKKDGEIVEMIIDGKSIPKEEFKKYDSFTVKEGIVVVDDQFPNLKGDPFFQAYEDSFKLRAKANDFTFNGLSSERQKTITKKRNEEGNTLITIDEPGKELVEIIVDGGEDGVVTIEGNKLGSGDTTIVIEGASFPKRFNPFNRTNDFKLSTDSVFWNGQEMSNEEFRNWVNENSGKEYLKIYEDAKRLSEMEEKLSKKLEEHKLKGYEKKNQLLYNEALIKKQKLLSEMKKDFRNKYPNSTAKLLEKLEATKHKDPITVYGFKHAGGHLTTDDVALMAKELKKDGLIKNEKNYSISLTSKKIKINGKKLSKQHFEKYLKLYEELTGSKMNKKSKFHFHRSED